MLFLRSWLEDYITINDLSDQQIADTITSKSSEVEEILKHTDYYNAKVLVGQIFNVRPHENADTLKVFDVNCGEAGVFQIVSAAPNVAEGLIVPVALVGCNLGFLSISQRSLRGVNSYGMCLGKSELFLESKNSSGLWELHQDFHNNDYTLESKLGQPINEVFPALFPAETTFDIKVLPNRMSEIGHHAGMALDLAICLNQVERLTDRGLELFYPEKSLQKKLDFISKIKKDNLSINSFKDQENFSSIFNLLRIQCDQDFYLPTLISKRLFLTKKNIQLSLVDYTNYWLYDFGSPTHIYSTKKLFGSNNILDITLNRTETIEEFEGLGNFGKVTIIPSTPIIKAKSSGESTSKNMVIPGVIGSLTTSFDYNEKDGIFEIANFDNEKVARTAFKIKFRSDGSRVWAGGVNKQLNLYCIYRIINDLSECNLTFVSGYFDGENIKTIDDFVIKLKEVFEEKTQINIDVNFLARRYQKEVDQNLNSKIEDVLRLVSDYKSGVLIAKKYFSNLKSKEDILEEVTRILGFVEIVKSPITLGEKIESNYAFEKKVTVKNLLSDFGFDEVKTRPFVSKDDIVNNFDNLIQVIKPYNSNEPYLRDNLISTLLKVASSNLLKSINSFSIFEINNINTFQNELIEKENLTCLTIDSNPYRLTSFLYKYLELVGLEIGLEFKIDDSNYSNYGKSTVYLDKNSNPLARLIQVSNKTKKKYQIPLSKVVWILTLDYKETKKVNNYKLYFDESDYPNAKRTYSFLINKNLKYLQIKTVLESSNLDNSIKIYLSPIERISLENKDIINIEVTFVNYAKTFETEFFENYEKQIISSLKLIDPEISLR